MALKSPLKKASHFRVDQADLLCKNKCGYYGNPSWKGYCSKCYRELYQKSSKHVAPEQPEVARRPASQPSPNAFSKFEEKKKQQEKGVASVRSLLKKPIVGSVRDTNLLKDVLPTASPAALETHALGSEFVTLLSGLADQQLTDGLRTRATAILTKLRDLQPLAAVDDWSDAVQDFYQDVAELVSRFGPAAGLSEEAEQAALDCIEGCLTQLIHPSVFCPAGDEDSDLKLHKRIRSLNWVTDKQLEANLASEHDLGVRATLESAMTEIIQMDAQRSPKEKLQCVVECSRAIFTALHKSRTCVNVGGSTSGSGAAMADGSSDSRGENAAVATSAAAATAAAPVVASSADDFLPAFIYIILKANPPRLQSNISYVTRFANPSRLNRGEGGYFFTNLCCVVDFIRKLNAESLNLSQEEFDAYMSGERTPEGGSGVGGVCASLYMCDGLRLMHENRLQLDELGRREAGLDAAVAECQSRAAEAACQHDSALDALLRSTCPLYPHRQPWRRRRVSPDAELGGGPPPQLPAPLLPQPAVASAAASTISAGAVAAAPPPLQLPPGAAAQPKAPSGGMRATDAAAFYSIAEEWPSGGMADATAGKLASLPKPVGAEAALDDAWMAAAAEVEHRQPSQHGCSGVAAECSPDDAARLSGRGGLVGGFVSEACQWEAMLDAMEAAAKEDVRQVQHAAEVASEPQSSDGGGSSSSR